MERPGILWVIDRLAAKGTRKRLKHVSWRIPKTQQVCSIIEGCQRGITEP
jgi:hypothetical protein